VTRYGDALLADGEQVVLRSRQHWLAWLVDGRIAVLVLVASLALLAIASFALEQGAPRFWLGALAFVLLLGSVLALARTWLAWRSQDYMVTNRRVVKVDGIIRKRSADSSLEKINDAVLEQGLFGRMFGFGNLEILTAAEIPVDRFYMLAQAQTFKRTMLEEKNRLERDVRMPPSPPIRAMQPVPVTPPAPPPFASPAMASAAVVDRPGAAVANTTPEAGDGAAPDMAEPGVSEGDASQSGSNADGGPAAMAAGTPGEELESGPLPRPARHSMSSEEITKLLTDLADLRDRGAISAEDYEAKKQDLLARL
jgi:membrane protein YdbS with pleckstrin-like domain